MSTCIISKSTPSTPEAEILGTALRLETEVEGLLQADGLPPPLGLPLPLPPYHDPWNYLCPKCSRH
eukprot:1358348-Amphidinium_carterae.1